MPVRLVAALWLGVAFALPSAVARAHIVVDVPSLSRLVDGADRVVRARIVGSAEIGPPGARRPVTDARVLETLVGDPGAAGAAGVLRFAAHGHGTASYAVGDEALLFLRRAERSRELGGLAPAGLEWVSLQEHDEKVLLDPPFGAGRVAAAREYAALARVSDPAQRLAAFGRLTTVHLAANDPALVRWALSDLLRAGGSLPLSAADLGQLRVLAADPERPIALRIGLLSELERRGALDDAPARWVALLGAESPADRLAAVRAARAHPSDPVTAALIGRLDDSESAIAEAAAVSLGVRGNDAAVPALTASLASTDARLRMAAIRGLGAIGTPAAVEALSGAARSHPEAATRRRARAELRVLGADSEGS